MTMTLRRKRQRRPTHPGEFLREDFLPDYELTFFSRIEVEKRRKSPPQFIHRFKRITGISGATSGSRSYDITAWMASNMRL